MNSILRNMVNNMKKFYEFNTQEYGEQHEEVL